MRALAALGAVLALAGCASRGAVAPPESVSPEITAAEAECPNCPAADEQPPGPGLEVAVPPAAPDTEAECQRAVGFFEAGEHKPAVDSLAAVLRAGASCDEYVLGVVAESQRRLAEADELARRGLEARRVGDVDAARERFQQALTIYPKYYWVQRLEHDLPEDFGGELQELRDAASAALNAGRADEALELLERAAGLPSGGTTVAEEITRVRAELAQARLGAALRAQRTGDVAQALTWTEQALAARPGPPVREQVIEFARRLGLTLFSAGELVSARDLWSAALTLDQANGLLLQYLDEVEARLRSLDAIKDEGE